jgi:hypothetical protein
MAGRRRLKKRPLQKPDADALLQGPYGLTHGGGGDPQLRSCRRKTAPFCDCQQLGQALQIVDHL